MHNLEKKLVDFLEAGTNPSLAMIGGIDVLNKVIPEIGVSPLLPEFVRIVLNSDESIESEDGWRFICGTLSICKNGIAMRECVDLLDQFISLDSEADNQILESYLNIAIDKTNESLARAATLDGALRIAIALPEKRFDLIRVLIRIDVRDSPDFLRWAAKIIGVAHSHWHVDELVNKLHELRDVADAKDEVYFELGMSCLSKALTSIESNAVAAELQDARFWFNKSLASPLGRPDSTLFLLCTEVLTEFSVGELNGLVESLANQIDNSVRDLIISHRSNFDPPWLRTRTLEVLLWKQLSQALRQLENELLEPSWYEPAVVIEQFLLPIYSASRTILKLNQLGGIESLVRPRIEGSLAAMAGQAHLMRKWFRQNQFDELAEDAKQLIEQADKLVSKHADDQILFGKRSNGLIESLITNSNLTANHKSLVINAIYDAFEVHLTNLTNAETMVIETCLLAVASQSDYHQSKNSKQLFNAILLWTITFLHARLEMTVRDEPAIAYLFKRADGNLAKEDDLQSDYKKFMESNIAGTKIEVMNVGGGRADVYFQFSAERIVVEVKRDSKDCSFDALEKAYSSQAMDYQNISARLGFLLVLDQTDRDGAAMHISELVKSVVLIRKGETQPRFLVIVKVPGERLRPSEQTKLAKKKG